jgi:hypothetical protein
LACRIVIQRPPLKGVADPARAAYSYSASIGSRRCDVPLPPEAKDSKEGFKHRLDLLCRLFRQFYDSYSVRPQEAMDGQRRQLHENAIIQLRDDIHDGLIDLDRIDPEANAELFSSRGLSHQGRILITTRVVTDPERRKYDRVVSHPAAHCIVWLTRRLRPHWEGCGPYDDGSGYLTLIAEGASDFLCNTHDSDADPATKACDRRAWCCHVIDRLLGKLKREL